ncbi:hypothetical protein IWT25_01404 [Secundilactobacillus pentosiphilus]|uniref:DUF5626 domain-containing protein n=1 Tax=Secundilactobacillus pentosiphilus TaxID=1714682 RepID=A0A1Z5IWL9_9LACO|nr:DUF5626 family protein [Secundilactobacillus pentosiphilus]GAX06079.1 hypothetical protein IWT25_01404 [Secundilactobacillus pentosiphilus]
MKKIILSLVIIVSSLLFPITVQAATVHVNHISRGSWSMGCNVTTSGNKITGIRDLSIKVSSGSVTNKQAYLKSGSAKIQFTRHLNLLTYHSSAIIKIKNGKLYVTAN